MFSPNLFSGYEVEARTDSIGRIVETQFCAELTSILRDSLEVCRASVIPAHRAPGSLQWMRAFTRFVHLTRCEDNSRFFEVREERIEGRLMTATASVAR